VRMRPVWDKYGPHVDICGSVYKICIWDMYGICILTMNDTHVVHVWHDEAQMYILRNGMVGTVSHCS